ncbi:alpha/beta hydrolase [Ferruginibacter sp. SUN002]|uniref:alpha/beta hydrolase n=1 Tax=Ferruginibacter sp. SUN002 TaxID=2937789 RepID=UPI003D35E33C
MKHGKIIFNNTQTPDLLTKAPHMKLYSGIIALMLMQTSFAQSVTEKTIIYSEKVKDSFELYVSTPAIIEDLKTYNVVYYCDANLKSGRKLRELISSDTYKEKTANTIFVGVGHIGNFHVLRRRDYILPTIKNGDTLARDEKYGHIEDFYQFLKTELIPKINSKYRTNNENNSILGHSLGGLFAFYCLFKNETLFTNYYALSPALWIDHYNIYEFNKLDSGNINERHLYFSTGGREVMNHIRKGTNRMNKFLNDKKYDQLMYRYDIHKRKTHNAQVPLSLDYILKQP